MGTSNFHNSNARKIYVVLESYEQPVLDEDGNETEETETYTPDSYEAEDLTDYIQETFKEQHKDLYWFKKDTNSYNELRSFGAGYICTLIDEKCFGDVQLNVRINCFIRSGYYEAANLDWELQIDCNSYSYNDDECGEGFELSIDDYYNSSMSEGLKKIQLKNMNKWIEKTKESLIEKVETIFEEIANPYLKVGTFSNGETVYQKAQ